MKLAQDRTMLDDEGYVFDVGERLAGPETQDLIPVDGRSGRGRAGHRALESDRVDGLWSYVKSISGPFGPKPAGGAREPSAQAGYVYLDGVRRGLGRVLAPDRVYKVVDTHDLSGAERQDREDGPLFRRAQVDLGSGDRRV